MHALMALTRANIKSYTRDRAAVFWTLAFPLVFIVLFGLIFQGSSSNLNLAWVDDDHSPQSAELRAAFAAQPGVTLVDTTQSDGISQMQVGKVDSVIVVPAGYGASVAASSTGTPGAPAQVPVYTLGPIIHNPQVVQELAAAVHGIEALGQGALAVRSLQDWTAAAHEDRVIEESATTRAVQGTDRVLAPEEGSA